ncbi:MAG: hypothetical protein ACR2PZ_17280 [Pseudomonadales bacterium]
MNATTRSKKRRTATPVAGLSLCLLLGLPAMTLRAAESDASASGAEIPVAELEPASEALSEAESEAWAKHAQASKIPQAKSAEGKSGKQGAADKTADSNR